MSVISADSKVRETLWAAATSLVLLVRMIATIATGLLAIAWLVVAIRHSLVTDWLWWTIGSSAILVLSTYLYSMLRVL